MQKKYISAYVYAKAFTLHIYTYFLIIENMSLFKVNLTILFLYKNLMDLVKNVLFH